MLHDIVIVPIVESSQGGGLKKGIIFTVFAKCTISC